MEDIGNWLYIIVLIIAGISGLFGSGKKKNKPTEVLGQPEYEEPEHEEEPEKPSGEKSFWELFDEALAENKKQPAPQTVKPVETPLPGQVSKPKQSGKPKQVSKPKQIPVQKHQDRITSFIAKESVSLLQEDDNIDDHFLLEEESFRDVSELRKAIIYTEILNRKY